MVFKRKNKAKLTPLVSVQNLTLNGTSGVDTLNGGAGNDLASGDIGIDWIDGGIGNDALIGGAGDDHLEGDDFVAGEAANDAYYDDAAQPQRRAV